MKPREIRDFLLSVLSRAAPDAEYLCFGSRAGDGPRHPYSDLDIAVKAPGGSFPRGLGMAEAEISESDIPFLVDLSDYRDLPPEFRRAVDDRAVPLAQLPDAALTSGG